jgi:hypothetical protein
MPFVVLPMMCSLALPAVRAQPITLLAVAIELRGWLLLVTASADLESWKGDAGVIPRRNRRGNALLADRLSAETIQAAHMELFERLVLAAHLAALRQDRHRLGHESPISV